MLFSEFGVLMVTLWCIKCFFITTTNWSCVSHNPNSQLVWNLKLPEGYSLVIGDHDDWFGYCTFQRLKASINKFW